MSNLLKNNAYHILGLDTSASQKDIQKRAKEIVKFLQIDDTPEYDLDLGIFDNFRTEESVKEAIQRLTSPKKQIKEYFFWFHIADDIDQQAVGVFRKKQPEEAVRIWEHHAEGDTIKALFYKKNLAILYGLLLFKENNEKYLKKSLQLWSEIINSTKFWSAFSKAYKLNDELDTDQAIITGFQNEAASYISDLYTELSHEHKDDSYISEFGQLFNVRGQKTEKAVLNPIFHDITTAVEKLEAMKVSEDGELDKEEAAQIKEYIGQIQESSNKLIDLGLYDDSQTKTIRDRAAAAIRSIVLDIHNNLDDIPKAEQLLRIAMQFVGTAGMKHKLQQDLDTFEQNKKDMDVFGPILTLINEKKHAEAIALIDKEMEVHKSNTELVNALKEKKKEAVTWLGVVEFVEGKKLFEKNQHDASVPYFQKSATLIYDNIDLFDVNKETIDSWLERIKENVKVMTSENADQIDEMRNKMFKIIDENFEEKFEQIAIKFLVDSYLYVGLVQVVKVKKAENAKSSAISWIVWIIIIIVLGALFG